MKDAETAAAVREVLNDPMNQFDPIPAWTVGRLLSAIREVGT